MRRTWTVTLLKHEQPDEGVWQELLRLVEAWNGTARRKFEPVMDFMWHVNHDASTQAELNRLIEKLQALHVARGASFHLASRQTLEEEDYAAAELIEMLGIDLANAPRPLVLNEQTAFAAGSPCPVCGWQDVFDSVQREPLAIDLARLEAETAPDGTPAGPGGWDVVNLPNGHKLISKRALSVLEGAGVKGYELRNVMDGATGRPTDRAFQILAERVVLVPCPEHTRVEGEPFCPACGTAYGQLEGYFWVRSDWIEGVEVLSRHRGKGAMLYLARRVFDLLASAGLNGLRRNDVLRVCRHE